MIRITEVFQNIWKSLLSISASFIIWSIGGLDLLILSVIHLMVIDFISGMYVGWVTKTLSSKRAAKGIVKKVFMFFIISCATVFSKILGIPSLRGAVITFYCATEFISILENAVKVGTPIPKKLKKILTETLEQCQDGMCEFENNKDLKNEINIDLDKKI